MYVSRRISIGTSVYFARSHLLMEHVTNSRHAHKIFKRAQEIKAFQRIVVKHSNWILDIAQ